MASSKRVKADHPGVFYRMSKRIGGDGEERVYYIVFKKNGKFIEEKVGRQYADRMTSAKANNIRSDRIEGRRLSRKELRAEAEASKRSEAMRPTVGRLWDLYQQAAFDRKGLNTDRLRYEKHIAPVFANCSPDEITTLDVDKLRSKLLKAGRSPQTTKHVLALLKRVIRFGIKKSLCSAPDPSKLHFEMPKVDNKKTETLTQEQLRKYHEAMDKELDQDAVAFLRLALATGMRKGALMSLRWEDIDFDTGFILLRGEAAKKGASERIPLSGIARSILQTISRKDSPYVFPGRNGGQRKDFRKIAERVKKNAGLPPDFRPIHGLRHAFASFIASTGDVDLYTLQKLLTHGSPQMTQRYAHLADEALQRATKVVDTVIGRSQSES